MELSRAAVARTAGGESRFASRIRIGTSWLITKPARPFDPQRYFEFRLYKEFSSGIPDQWMSHAIDMVHWFMDDNFPTSVISHGGVYAWHDGRENADTFQTLLEYPKGFLVSYSTSFGNDAPSFTRYMGKKGHAASISGAKGVRDIRSSRKRGHTRTTRTSTRREHRNTILLPGKRACRRWALMT